MLGGAALQESEGLHRRGQHRGHVKGTVGGSKMGTGSIVHLLLQ